MRQDRSAYLFQKYIDKTCTPSELKEFMDVVKSADDSDVLNLVMDNFWNKSEEIDLNSKKAETILNKVFAADIKPATKKPALSIQWLGWAAAIFIVSIAAILVIGKTSKPLSSAKSEIKPAPIVHSTEFITAKTLEEHQKVTLPDGSTVILNNNSSVTYPKVFGKRRDVTLTGEGYFDIKHDDKKTFTVYTDKVRTTVLGTAFNIKAYHGDQNIEVTVTRGKVSVLDSNSTLGVLTPNQQIIFNKNYKKTNLTKVVAKSIVQWQENDLFFDDISMEEATQILSKKFSIPIVFTNDDAKKCRFTATFLKGESIQEILKIICSYNNAQYETTAGGITIKGEGCE